MEHSLNESVSESYWDWLPAEIHHLIRLHEAEINMREIRKYVLPMIKSSATKFWVVYKCRRKHVRFSILDAQMYIDRYYRPVAGKYYAIKDVMNYFSVPISRSQIIEYICCEKCSVCLFTLCLDHQYMYEVLGL